MPTLYLALGSNLGNKEANILRAEDLIESAIGHVAARSTMLVTEPWGFSSANNFVNAAVRVDTFLSPRAALERTQRIERLMGRAVKSTDGRYHDRIIDIDILMYDDVQVNESDLRIPHPLMFERDFVMTPLREVLDAEGQKLIKQIKKDDI